MDQLAKENIELQKRIEDMQANQSKQKQRVYEYLTQQFSETNLLQTEVIRRILN